MDMKPEHFNPAVLDDGPPFDEDDLIVPEVPGVAPAATVGEYKAWFAAEAES